LYRDCGVFNPLTEIATQVDTLGCPTLRICNPRLGVGSTTSDADETARNSYPDVNRWPPPGPWSRFFDLRGQSNERRFVAESPNKLHAHRETVRRPM
jgi:hypothetical protein